MGNPIVRAVAGRFPHRVAARIAGAIRSALFRGEGGPSPHPSPAALRAASAREGLSPQPSDSLWIKRPAWESVLDEMGNPIVRAVAGRFPHRVAARIAGAIRSALFRGEGGPSPAALRAASAREGLSPQPSDSLWIKRPAWESVLDEMGNPIVRADAGRFPHRVTARIAGAIRSALFRGEGGPSPHPSPAALRAASAHEGLSPQTVSGARSRRPGLAALR